MTNTWPEGVVADKVHRFLRSHPNKTFETIVTFDDLGVSAHPNHIRVHQGVLRVLKLKHMHVRQVLALRTNVLVRKYMSYTDILCMNSFDLNFCVFNSFSC
jgi:LmbE family N-acetylglucosaminyl deacetylase